MWINSSVGTNVIHKHIVINIGTTKTNTNFKRPAIESDFKFSELLRNHNIQVILHNIKKKRTIRWSTYSVFGVRVVIVVFSSSCAGQIAGTRKVAHINTPGVCAWISGIDADNGRDTVHLSGHLHHFIIGRI